ncbi:MAG: aminoacyl-tRNA hydrolase [Pseudobdellovibrionaceae bacterium]|jgi:PTH1 family peptidyl-tRNA hydrolase|nr:aminoacyl-tRNA hydrolase [Pseudobdellovibrionaceae bacterium]
MILLVGLGNPGSEYERNRHNIGFMAIDEIADFYGFSAFRQKYKGLYSEGTIKGEKVALLKPQTYMNESGRSVGEVAKFYKIPTSDIIAFHDELDCAPGKIKIKIGGGAAGHNGLRSMDDWLDNSNYKRVRMGIGHPGDKERVAGYVLGNFAKSDEDWLTKLIAAIAKETPVLLKGDDAGFLNNVARAIQPPKPKKEKTTEQNDQVKKDEENGI